MQTILENLSESAKFFPACISTEVFVGIYSIENTALTVVVKFTLDINVIK